MEGFQASEYGSAVRLTPEQTIERLCSAILETLALNGSWLTQPQILAGWGQGWQDPAAIAAAFAELRLRGLIVVKKRRKGVGRHGRPRPVYAATVGVVLVDDTRDPVGMSPAIALDPAARRALEEYAHAKFLAARADAEASLEDEQFWRMTTLALRGEPGPKDSDGDTPDGVAAS
jgi:hypothetical protein